MTLSYRALPTAAIAVGVGLGLAYSQLKRVVTLTIVNEVDPEVEKMIRQKTSLDYECQSYRMDIPKGIVASPNTLAEAMFSSWAMIPERFVLWMAVPQYQPLPIEKGKHIFGLFDVLADDADRCVLNWKLEGLGLGGLHVLRTTDDVARFDTIFWAAKGSPPLLKGIHYIYSRILLFAAVSSLTPEHV